MGYWFFHWLLFDFLFADFFAFSGSNGEVYTFSGSVEILHHPDFYKFIPSLTLNHQLIPIFSPDSPTMPTPTYPAVFCTLRFRCPESPNLSTMTAEIILPHLAADPVLKPLTEQLPFPKHRPAENNLFVDLLRSISSQQLSTKAAATIYTRFCALFPDHRPDAGLLLDMSPDLLRAAGLSGQKAGYMHHVATFFIHQNLLHQDFQTWEDRDILQTLTQIKGVGVWTVEMLLMFSLNRPDILPVGDLGIQQGIQRLYGLNQSGKALRKEMEKIAEPWRPYRSYACYYLWNWKDQKPTP